MNLSSYLKPLIALSAVSCSLAHAANCLPYLPSYDQSLLRSEPAKKYILPATPLTSQWGVYDSQQPPVLTINSGDTVVIETMAASDNQVVPGTSAEQIAQMNLAVEGRGPHTLTGPIYVQGAEPGDVLRIHFNKIVPRAYASNNTMPGKGLFPEEFPNGHVTYFYLDLKKNVLQFAPNIVVPIAPFPGVIAVQRAEPGRYDSIPPGPFGGNMDLREMTEGTTLFLPVFVKGGRIWTGDSHAGQGNGEIDLTAIETAFEEFNITVDVMKNQPLTWPRVETATAWIAMGYDKDLNKALEITQQETIKLIRDKRGVDAKEAEKIMYATWNCPISEVVNGIQGTYCMLPKALDVKAYALSKIDDDKNFVTYGKDKDLEKAMKTASLAMINRIATEKGLQRIDAYTLLSIAMDCRIWPYKSGDKEVSCMLAKNLWTA